MMPSKGLTTFASISAGSAPGSTAMTAAAGIVICGFSSRGVVRIAQMPKRSAAIMTITVSFESMKRAAMRPVSVRSLASTSSCAFFCASFCASV